MKVSKTNQIVNNFLLTGKTVTHYFNGYGFTNKTNQVKKELEAMGLKSGIDFKFENVMFDKGRTIVVKLK